MARDHGCHGECISHKYEEGVRNFQKVKKNMFIWAQTLFAW